MVNLVQCINRHTYNVHPIKQNRNHTYKQSPKFNNQLCVQLYTHFYGLSVQEVVYCAFNKLSLTSSCTMFAYFANQENLETKWDSGYDDSIRIGDFYKQWMFKTDYLKLNTFVNWIRASINPYTIAIAVAPVFVLL